MASKKTQLQELLAQHQPPVIDPAFFSLLQQELHPISTAYLRRLLLQADAPLHPLVEGVRLDTFRHFCRSLFLLNEMHQRTGAETKTIIRRLIIDAKNHARWSDKSEMVEWLLVWLHDPTLFDTWAKLRLQVIEARLPPPE